MSECPTCGAPIELIGLRVDLESNTVIVDDRAIRLAPREAELLTILSEIYPRVASYEFLLARLYGACGGEDPGRGCVPVFVTKLRGVLRGTNWNIENVWGRGYRLARVK